MSSVLAIVSRALFDKMVPKGIALGSVVDAWSAAANQAQLTDITSAIKSLRFESGSGIKAKKGTLGMSLQTPRALTEGDVKLLRRMVSNKPASKTVHASAAYAKAAREVAHHPKAAARPTKKSPATKQKSLLVHNDALARGGLRGAGVGPAHVWILSQSDLLHSLDLSRSSIGVDGIIALSKTKAFSGLTELCLTEFGLAKATRERKEACVDALVSSTVLKNLDMLAIHGNELAGASKRLVARWDATTSSSDHGGDCARIIAA